MRNFTKLFFTKTSINEGIVLFINFLFLIKYTSRFSTFYVFISLFITSIIYILLYYKKLIISKFIILKAPIYIYLVTYTIVCGLLFFYINPSSINVDRWSVITSFWDSYFKGDYVYLAKSNVGNYPGPMPFYFVLALPFYLIGELGYYSLLGIFTFFILLKYTKINNSTIFFYVVFLSCSIFYIWEILCRSTIFFNGILVVYVINILLNTNFYNLKKVVIVSTLLGLTLSTRNVYVIPFIIVFVYLLKSKIIGVKHFFYVAIVSLCIFCLTFLPFIHNHLSLFLKMNPFIIQSSGLMPFNLTLIPITLSFIAGYYAKNKIEIFNYSGYLLFLTIVIYFIYSTFRFGFYNTFFKSYADISYFILCIPFLLFSDVIKFNKLN